MLALVVGTAAAAACSERKPPPVAVGRDMLGEQADQIMFNINTILTDRGMMRAQLQADTAYFFDDNSRVELRGVQTTFYDATGKRSSVLTSREGTYNMRSQETEARKNVVVVSDEGRRLETEQLRYNQVRDEISSDSAFVLTEPTRRLTGIGFVSDPNMRHVQVLKVTPGSTGTFTLPGQ
ncbi:MAG TPA: LPS export ABC transporter periplasmic protein LptC [Gemmatimonadaceae bacterium]|nr:LPS export ABC transporter periplasmic protein LptC [Gemmatimonadaceae bacterium]